jgi:predicted nucleic acid-binding protein
MKNYVFDSYSLISYFEKDMGYKKIIDLLDQAINDSVYLLMNIVNWGEIYYITLREQGLDKANLFEKNFEKLPIDLIYPDKSLIKNASKYKAFNALSYADCIAAATANINNSVLVTGDKEFKKLEKEITIDWL